MKQLVKQYVHTMKMEAVASIGESPLFLTGYLLRLLRVLALLAVWRTVYFGRGNIAGMSLTSVLTYTLISEICGDLLACRTGLESAWFNGSITMRFLRPFALFHQFSAEMLGRALVSVPFFSGPLIILSPLMGISVSPTSCQNGFLFLGSLLASVLVGLGLEYLFVGAAIAVQIHPYAITNFRSAITAVVSGAMIPLRLLPWGMGRWLSWLPFASQASAPLRIFTGTGSPLRLIALQCFWVLVLWPLSAWIWWATREKMVSFGG